MSTSTSGYTHCACRDCFEIAIGQPGTAMCLECDDHNCDGLGECQVPPDDREDHPGDRNTDEVPS